MKILNFGSCNIDYVYTVDHMVCAGETISATKLELFPGGKGLNQSVAAARAGADIYHAGCIGNNGEFLKEILAESGANTDFLKKENIANGHAIIQVDKNGENCICIYQGSNGMISKEYVDFVLDNFDSGDILLLQNEINNMPYIVESAYKRGIDIVFNPSPFNDGIKEINIDHISYLLVNQVEAKALFGQDNVSDSVDYIREHYPELKVVITLGKKGCVFVDKKEMIFQSSFVVDTVDTTAAGDTFAGYFVSFLSKGEDYAHAIKYASAASALAVSKMGAATSIPTIDEVNKAIKVLTPYTSEDELKNAGLREKIFLYIEENLVDANLKGLANLLGYSVSYTGALVRKLTKSSFSRILQAKRCEIAAKMLRNTNLSVGEIIRKTGYENESFFRRKFKEIYGEYPLKYRKKYEGKGENL